MRNDAVSDGLPPRPGGLELFRLFPVSLNRYISLDMLLIHSLVKAIITASKCRTYLYNSPLPLKSLGISSREKLRGNTPRYLAVSIYFTSMKIFEKVYNRHHLELTEIITLGTCIDSYHPVHFYIAFPGNGSNSLFPLAFPFV